MTPDPTPADDTPADALQDPPAPACVMSFNANDASGAGGLAGDVSSIAAMGSHALPVITSVLVRDTAEVFDHSPLEADLVVEQARSILEDVTLAAWKVGYLGSAEIIGAVAEILSDYPDVPLVAHMPSITWLDDDELQAYCDAFRDLVLPQTRLLVGSHQTLTDLLLPDWDGSRPASPRELAAAAAEKGTPFVLVTSMAVPTGAAADQYIDNVLATAKGAVTGEKFERFDVAFVGAGDTLTATLAALLANGSEVHDAVGEALTFLDQSLDAGFRPGMGNVVPDRFFWAAPAPDDEAEGAEGTAAGAATDDAGASPKGPRQIH
ncbi:MAG: hydroxymethylpyrimidine/phosphomethylpyrimidine kinase [Ideonella sp.]|nr:hydroxymethylpyrimidine/phosphomethylpyrimidine kinase [Ideonella sp.]